MDLIGGLLNKGIWLLPLLNVNLALNPQFYLPEHAILDYTQQENAATWWYVDYIASPPPPITVSAKEYSDLVIVLIGIDIIMDNLSFLPTIIFQK